MENHEQFAKLADDAAIAKTMLALQGNGINALVVEDGTAAKAKLLELLPSGAPVMDMTSMTLQSISVADEVNSSGRYDAVRSQLNKLDPEKDARRKQEIGAAPPYAIGSVHAVTQNGEVMIASNTGSQLPAYAYGAGQVIWVAGTQKIVANRDEGFRRIYEYCLPLEDKRAQQAYGEHSNVSKVLVINKEVKKDRLTLILVKERLGF